MVIIYRAFSAHFCTVFVARYYSPILGRKDRGHTGTSWYVVVRDETDLAK